MRGGIDRRARARSRPKETLTPVPPSKMKISIRPADHTHAAVERVGFTKRTASAIILASPHRKMPIVSEVRHLKFQSSFSTGPQNP